MIDSRFILVGQNPVFVKHKHLTAWYRILANNAHYNLSSDMQAFVGIINSNSDSQGLRCTHCLKNNASLENILVKIKHDFEKKEWYLLVEIQFIVICEVFSK